MAFAPRRPLANAQNKIQTKTQQTTGKTRDLPIKASAIVSAAVRPVSASALKAPLVDQENERPSRPATATNKNNNNVNTTDKLIKHQTNQPPLKPLPLASSTGGPSRSRVSLRPAAPPAANANNKDNYSTAPASSPITLIPPPSLSPPSSLDFHLLSVGVLHLSLLGLDGAASEAANERAATQQLAHAGSVIMDRLSHLYEVERKLVAARRRVDLAHAYAACEERIKAIKPLFEQFQSFHQQLSDKAREHDRRVYLAGGITRDELLSASMSESVDLCAARFEALDRQCQPVKEEIHKSAEAIEEFMLLAQTAAETITRVHELIRRVRPLEEQAMSAVIEERQRERIKELIQG